MGVFLHVPNQQGPEENTRNWKLTARHPENSFREGNSWLIKGPCMIMLIDIPSTKMWFLERFIHPSIEDSFIHQ